MSEPDAQWCFSCGAPIIPLVLDDPDPRTYNDTVACPSCGFHMAWQTQLCASCGARYSDDWWAEQDDALIEDVLTDLANRQGEHRSINAEIDYWEKINLCCDLDFDLCECAEPIPAESVYAIPYDIYQAETECHHCAFVESAVCPPLRQLAKMKGESGSIPTDFPGITPCENFRILDANMIEDLH